MDWTNVLGPNQVEHDNNDSALFLLQTLNCIAGDDMD